MLVILRPEAEESHGKSGGWRDSAPSITVWGRQRILAELPKRPWLNLSPDPLLEGNLPSRLFWQHIKLTRLARQNCDVLLVPGSTYTGGFKPFVAMSQSLLPFEPSERRRYGLTWLHLRYLLLEKSQGITFHYATGVIFLTRTAQQVVARQIGAIRGKVAIVPHGVAKDFERPPQPQQPLSAYSWGRLFRWLYVSIVNFYKHQWHVVEAIAALRREGVPVELDLVGPAYPPALRRLQEIVKRIDPRGEFIHYRGGVPYHKLMGYYHQANGFVFASSCETFGQTLLEAMISGLLIACSNRSAMPEILGGAGVYFDPENPQEIAQALNHLMLSPQERERCAWDGYTRAAQFSWERCARETFSFLAKVAGGSGS
ncbi:MAG: glycosyltransferase family 4 protein [Deltaproteobacteria bacterium]|nr:glycosyltransferase family 4 protein [Deltaproteobacteria bacterium]